MNRTCTRVAAVLLTVLATVAAAPAAEARDTGWGGTRSTR